MTTVALSRMARWRRGGKTLLLWIGLWGIIGLSQSCDYSIDTARKAPPKGTLGHDIYGALCDRLGASVLSEDLTGSSYHSICHYADSSLAYGDTVRAELLPAASGEAATVARARSIAKLELLATRRLELINAFNHAFPDIYIPDPAAGGASCSVPITEPAPPGCVRLHDALLGFSQSITRLYEENPYEPGSAPIQPQVTQALGRMFQGLQQSEERLHPEDAQNPGPNAREALSRSAGRQGYRPFQVALGAIRTMLAYCDGQPEECWIHGPAFNAHRLAMRQLVQSSLGVLGPGGSGHDALQQLLRVVKHELATAEDNVYRTQLATPLTVDDTIAQPSRPRSAIELARALLLDEHPDYLGPSGAPPRYITRRDRRGVAVPCGQVGNVCTHIPGAAGTVPAPFADTDGDGFADTDAFGRFIDTAGGVLALETPFFIPSIPSGPYDPSTGRHDGSELQYLDTSQTLIAALTRDLQALVDPLHYASEGELQPWLSEHEALMYSLAGVHILAGGRWRSDTQSFGPPEPARYDFASETILPAGAPCPSDRCLDYTRFRGEDSPIVDLLYAAGQVLADPDSDMLLLHLIDLLENHQQVVARLMGAVLRVDEIADEHDALAAQGLEPLADLPDDVPVYDEIAQVLNQMTKHPRLIRKLVEALADPVVVGPHPQHPLIPDPPVNHLGETFALYMTMRDQYSYNIYDINGPAINLTDGYPSLSNPHNPVDFTQPQIGDNRSMFERSAQLIADGNRLKACNKQGARLYTGLLIPEYYPLFGGTYDQCELFTFTNVAAMYLDSTLPLSHPKHAVLEIKPGELDLLLDAIGWVFGSADEYLETTSGINGMTLLPTAPALNRLMYFGATSEQWGDLPDHDSYNEGTNTEKFISHTIEPLGPNICPKGTNDVPVCSNMWDVMRLRDGGTIFAWERVGFYDYLVPQMKAFAEVACNEAVTACDISDYTGENFYIDLVSILSRHWPGPDHDGTYCNSTGSPATNPRYCSEAGLNRYQPILGDAFMTDLIPALHEFSLVASQLAEVTVVRGPKAGQVYTGAEVMEILVKILFDQQYAAAMGLTDRLGSPSATWVDGTPQPQHTIYTLFADALHKMDTTFTEACAGLSGDDAAACQSESDTRRSKWKRARSELVDQFLAVAGQGPEAHFKNPAAARTLVSLLKVLREQLNANCPDREVSGQCDWARHVLPQKLADLFSRPMFAATSQLTDAVNRDEAARRELERFLSYALAGASSGDALQGLLASVSDILQLLTDDGTFAPIFRSVANVANPADDPEGPGVVDRLVHVLQALSGDEYDRYHVLDYVLPALVTPVTNLDGTPGMTPVEIMIDAIADINRLDVTMGPHQPPLGPPDYEPVFQTVRDFLQSETRGFEQLYYIVQNRPK